jgi:hypothetical protein
VTDFQMPPLTVPQPKRIVLSYTTGIAKDTSQIIGLANQQPPAYLELDMVDGTKKGFSLIRVTSRLVEYREIVAPNGGLTDVDKAQQ